VKKNLEWNQAYDEGRAALEQGRLPEAVYYLRRAVEKGAEPLSQIEDAPFGRLYRVEDVEGHRWMFVEPSA